MRFSPTRVLAPAPRRKNACSTHEKMKNHYIFPYLFSTVLTTALSFALAEYIQHGPFPFHAKALSPIIIPLVVSYWCSGYFDSPLAWRFIYIAVSLVLHLLLFLPVLLNQKFKNRLVFVITQIVVIVVYLLVSIPFFNTFAGWMSV